VLFVQVLGREGCGDKIPRPKRAKQLPVVMRVEEVERLVRSLANIEHRTILQVKLRRTTDLQQIIGLTRQQTGGRDREMGGSGAGHAQ